jgi:energy-coupling factor transporter ATP-binding protein EcfA2
MPAVLSKAAMAVHARELTDKHLQALRVAAAAVAAVLGQHQDHKDRRFLAKEKFLQEAGAVADETHELTLLLDAGLQKVVTILGTSGLGKTTLINAAAAATQASPYEYATRGENREAAMAELTAARAAIERYLGGAETGGILHVTVSTLPHDLFSTYSSAVEKVIQGMHEALANLFGENKEGLLGELRWVQRKACNLVDEQSEDNDEDEVKDLYRVLVQELTDLTKKATEPPDSIKENVKLKYAESGSHLQQATAAKALLDTFTRQMQEYAETGTVPDEPFLLVTPPANNGGVSASTFLNTEVRLLPS